MKGSKRDGHHLFATDILGERLARRHHNPCPPYRDAVLVGARADQGESWWESDLLSAAKDLLACATPDTENIGRGEGTSGSAARPSVKDWLIQGQVRALLVVLLSRVDPVRLTEVDLIMEKGKVGSVHGALGVGGWNMGMQRDVQGDSGILL